jgi:glycosyltransferase involved in cell wall biosynthesis
VIELLRRVPGAVRELIAIPRNLKTLRAELDALKSTLDVPREWFVDFERWRTATPFPAKPLVSVCIATYNRSELLTERAIPSILAQTYSNLELIIVGDGCTDDTEERVRALEDRRIRFLNLDESRNYPEDPTMRWMVAGTRAVNTALQLCRGDFITHLDDDDEHLPHRLEALVEFATQERCDFVWHPFWFQWPSGRWALNHAHDFAFQQVTTSSVFYRSWFTRLEWNPHAYELHEPGDWNRFRRIRRLGPAARRFPEPLLKHYRERNQ